MKWTMLDPRMTLDRLGYIPDFLSEDDPEPAAKQIDKNYTHGGGWESFKHHRMNPKTYAIKYPGDPALRPLASAWLRNELILYYQGSWVAIVQPDGAWDIARVD
jgi:hypothetical protein